MEILPAPERHSLPTVGEALRFPELQAGRPEIVAGRSGLDREVRWAHVAAGAGVAALLDGGELILTTGVGWPRDDAGLAQLAEDLLTAGSASRSSALDPPLAQALGDREGSDRPHGVSGIVLELGRGFDEAPPTLVSACEQHGVPLIVLHREVRFVQVTQRVHQRILAAQNEALRARSEVHAMLTDLGLNRSPVDYVVEQLAQTLGAPVILEDSSHLLVAFAALGQDATESLELWRAAAGGEPRIVPGSERVHVEARGTRWGTLTALPGPPHAAGRRTVLELGAFALALGRLDDAEGEQWLQFGSKRVFDMLLGGRYRNDAELAAQLAAAGLPIEGRLVFAATLRGTGDFGSHRSLERASLETALRRAVAPEGRVLLAADESADGQEAEGDADVLLALISLPAGDARGVPARPQRGADGGAAAPIEANGAPPLALRLARELEMLIPGPTPAGWRAHLALGTPAQRLRQLIASLEQLRAAGLLPPSSATGRVTVQQAERQPLAHLVRGLAGLPELQEFATDALGPLIEHDRQAGTGHSGDLLDVLAAYTAQPTNRSLAAKRARLSRSVFYQRLALIEELLGVKLDDGETIATLTVALLAHPR